MGIKYNNVYRISDLKLAAAVSLNFPILKLEKVTKSKISFVFEDSKNLQESVASYWNRTMQVMALDYANQLDALKTQVYEELSK